MEEWKEYKLKEICLKITDGSHSSPEAIPLGYPMFSVKDMLENRFDYTRCKHISKDDFLKLKKGDCVPQKGDVLVAKDGSFLKQIFVCKETKEECILSSIAIFRPNKDIIYPEFLSYLLKSPKVYNYITSNCVSGSALPRIILKDFKEINVTIPNISVQKKVLDILLPLDDKIELNRRINENLEQQTQALFKSWFVENTNIELNYHELGNITSITAGGDKPSIYSKKLTEKCYIPIYSNGIENEGLYGYTDFAKINSPGITISARGTIGYICLRTKPYVPIVRLISVIPNIEGLSAEYLYLWALTQNFSATGTTQQQLTVPNLKKIPIGIPTKEILEKFNSIVIPIFQLIEKNKDENMILAHLRDILLPKLMSGELRINDLSI